MARRLAEAEEDALIEAQALVFDAMEAPTKAGRVAAGEAGLGERSSRRWGATLGCHGNTPLHAGAPRARRDDED